MASSITRRGERAIRGLCVRRTCPFLAVLVASSALAAADVAQAQTAAATPPPPIVSVKEGRLTVRVENRSQDWILEEISRQAKVAITRVSGSGPRHVTMHFQDLSLDEGLRQILASQDAFFFYGAAGKTPAVLRAVWIYAKGKGEGVEPVPPEAWASSKDLERDVADPDPDVRARAVEALIERKHDGARDIVLDALKDQDDGVRSTALHESLANDVDLPTELLTELALGDPSPDVRFLALDGLADHAGVRAIAERAAHDPSLPVRQKAREILQELDGTPHPPPPPQTPPRGGSQREDRTQ